MTKYCMIVLTNPIEGRDAEFNHWYDNIHLRDVVAIPGVTGARRFEGVVPSDCKYAAIYDLECDDPQSVLNEITARWKTDRMPTSDAFDDSKFVMMVVKPISQYPASLPGTSRREADI
jgi:hypothetical protein